MNKKSKCIELKILSVFENKECNKCKSKNIISIFIKNKELIWTISNSKKGIHIEDVFDGIKCFDDFLIRICIECKYMQ